MKRIILLLTVLALLAASVEAFAENWWSGIGPDGAAQTVEPTPEPDLETKKPGLNLGDLFGGLLGRDESQQEETAELEPDVVPAPTPPAGDDAGDVEGEPFGEDGLYGEDGYQDEEMPVEEGDGYLGDALFDSGVLDITAKPYGGPSQYAVVGNWTVAYGNCDDHYCIFGWNENTREYHILAETVVSDFVPAGDVFAYYGEVKKGKFGWLIRDPNADKPVSLSLNELNSIFWSDEDYLYYFTYGKGSGGTYHRMDHKGKNKKQLGKLNGRAVAMMPDGGVVVFNSSKNRVEIFQGGKSETVYEPKDEISNVISTGREIWVAHWDYFGLLKDGELNFRFPGRMLSYAATTDQIIAVLDDGSIRLNVLMLNDAYGAHAVVGQVTAQENITVEVTPGWYNRVVVWGQRESLEFHTPYTDAWLPYGHHDLESAMDAGFTPARSGADTQAEDDTVERRISEKLFLEGEDEILKDAAERGIYVTHDRDGMYSYLNMTAEQHNQLLFDRSLELLMRLELLVTMGFIDSYDEHGDFSLITLYTTAESAKDEALLNNLNPIGILATAYQALLHETEAPECFIYLTDQSADVILDTLHGPGDFLIE